MTVNLFKDSSSVARELGDELRTILAELDPADSQPLLARLTVEAHPTPLLVFTGYHSSGKSTLIEALTNRAFNIAIGSGVTTDMVTEYDWDGDIRLVDTPGVRADRPEHDARAEQALQAADLVLFAVPVELFDDALVDHLRDVLGRLGKSRQTLIVITKAGTMEAAAGLRENAITEALGPFAPIPWVECDAQYYLDGLELEDSSPADAAAFIEASGLARVTALINDFASHRGELGTLSQPFQLLLAIATEASAFLTEDPNEQAALAVLARQRSALTKKRMHLNDLLEAKSLHFRRDAVRAATQFADSIEHGEANGEPSEAELDDYMKSLNEDLGAALGRFEQSVTQVLGYQFEDLASEVLAIGESEYGRLAIRLGDAAAVHFDSHDVAVSLGQTPMATAPEWAGDLSKYVKHFQTLWGAGDGVKAAAGTNGHKVVLKVGHAFGKKFKPWEAARTANKIGKSAKVGGAFIGIGLEAYGVFAEERAAVIAERARISRRRSITEEILAQADAIIADALHHVGRDLDGVFKPELARIDAMASQVHGVRSTRSDLRERLASVQERATSQLRSLGNTAAIRAEIEGSPDIA